MKSLLIIWTIAILSGAALFAVVDYGTAPSHVYAQDDSCPANEYLQGYDKETGSPVCKASVVPASTLPVQPVPVDNLPQAHYEGVGK